MIRYKAWVFGQGTGGTEKFFGEEGGGKKTWIKSDMSIKYL